MKNRGGEWEPNVNKTDRLIERVFKIEQEFTRLHEKAEKEYTLKVVYHMNSKELRKYETYLKSEINKLRGVSLGSDIGVL